MRVIKFRAFHKLRKEMYKVHGWHDEYVFKDTLDGVGNDGNPDKLLDIQLMQFTELSERHGEHIYEGDIVRHYIENEKGDCFPIDGEVKMVKGCWCVSDERYPLFAFPNELIGNIYENPNLLQ